MASLLGKLRSKAGGDVVAAWAEAGESSRFANTKPSRSAVTASEELERILAIPRRPQVDLDGVTGAAFVKLMTDRLRRHRTDGCACASYGRACIKELRPAQAWALYEAPIARGVFAPIGVGHGKTGLDILMAGVIPNCKLAILLIPPGSRDTVKNEYLLWREHFKVPSLVMGETAFIVPGMPALHVIPYSILSRPESTAILEKMRPDLIISDEGHRLRHRDTAGTGRLLRYAAAHHETTRLCIWSGTFAKGSIKNFAHLLAFALGENSPLPLDPNIVDEWAPAIDPSDWPAPAGALKKLVAPGESLYTAVHRRMVETCGFVATRESAIDASINIMERKPPSIPEVISKNLVDFRKTWIRPDGEEIVDALEASRVLRELACGFYYRWKFPHNEPEELILEWFDRRQAWHRELREKLKRPAPHLDSPLLCANAAIRFYRRMAGEAVDSTLPQWAAETWPAWYEIKDSVYHETEPVWLDDYLARDAAAWAAEHRGIVWYQHEAFGRRVAQLGEFAIHGGAAFAMHGGGIDAEKRILAETGKVSIIASIKSHGSQRDGLQRKFKTQLVANPPSSGDDWEQLLGRLHRIGQEADEVDAWVYRHTSEMAEAIDRAVEQAKFVRGVMGSAQKLLVASVNFPLAQR